MTLFLSLNYLFCQKITALDENMNKLKQKAAPRGMMSITPLFLMEKKKRQ